MNPFAFIDGYKSKIGGAIMILIGIAELVGIDVIGDVTQATALSYIMGGWALISVKSAIDKIGG